MALRKNYLTSNLVRFVDDPYLFAYGRSNILDPGEFDDVIRDESSRAYQAANRFYYELKIYEELERDAHVFAVLESRKLDVVQREWIIEPASQSAKDKRNAQMVEAMLRNLATTTPDAEKDQAIISTGTGFDQACHGLLDSLMYGVSMAEIMWAGGKEIYPQDLRTRHPRRFGFTLTEDGWVPRLRTRTNIAIGEPIPPRKFIFHHHQLHYGPYGRGLGHRLFWPVFFKRQDIKFWLVFVEKFASPTTIAKFPVGASDAEKDAVMSAIQSIASETGVGLPEGYELDLLEASRSSSADSYEKLANWCDAQISKAVLGQTGTTDQSTGGGSRARDEVAASVSLKRTKADADMLAGAITNSLIKWIIRLNAGPDAAVPRLWWKFPELEVQEDLNARVQRDRTLYDMGFVVTRDYVIKTYGVELQDEKPEGPTAESQLDALFGGGEAPAPTEPTPAPAPEAEAPPTPEQAQQVEQANQDATDEEAPEDLAEPDDRRDSSDDYADQAIIEMQPILADWSRLINEAVDQSNSFEELEQRLLQLQADTSQFAEILGASMAAAEAAGRYEVIEEGERDG
jgi:phage gp29-like protein